PYSNLRPQMLKIKVFLALFFAFSSLFYFIENYFLGISGSTKKGAIEKIEIPPTVSLNSTEESLRKSSAKFFEESLVRTRFNGAMLVAHNGKIVFEEYAGLKEVIKGEAIDSATSFHLASVSKTFTAMAVLKLWEDGKIDIDEKVSKYLSGFPFTQITVRNLLSHRSGLPNYVYFAEQVGWNKKKYLHNNDMLNLLIANRSRLKIGRPNAYFDYCNTNYAILAILVEKVSGKSFAAYMDQTFFAPIGMMNSFVFDINQTEKVLPSFKYNNRLEPMMFLDAVYGDKNIYSTTRDLLKWDIALNSGILFKQQTLDQAFRGYSYERKGVKNYGLGWRLYEMPSGKKIVYHNGWWHGNNTVFSKLMQDSTTIIVLGNKFNRNIYQAKKIAGIFTGYGIQLDDDE
ncbi:MAG: beta-lactamase family protein, partial [Chitinophagaceae bacterium]|nr:beta-lactamase family protein [Chitinophagaceae bacterium]